MYHSQIRIYEMDIFIPVCKTFLMFVYIYIEHRNLETRKTLDDFLVQVRNFLLPLSIKVLRHKERDTHSFYSGFFICPPSRAAPVTRPLAWLWRTSESQPSSPEAELNSTNWHFQNPPCVRFRCMTSFTPTGQPFYRIFILTSMNDTSSSRVR